MHTITMLPFFNIKIQFLMILKMSLLTELEKNNKDSQKGNKFFGVGPVLGGKVGARQTNIF